MNTSIIKSIFYYTPINNSINIDIKHVKLLPINWQKCVYAKWLTWPAMAHQQGEGSQGEDHWRARTQEGTSYLWWRYLHTRTHTEQLISTCTAKEGANSQLQGAHFRGSLNMQWTIMRVDQQEKKESPAHQWTWRFACRKERARLCTVWAISHSSDRTRKRNSWRCKQSNSNQTGKLQTTTIRTHAHTPPISQTTGHLQAIGFDVWFQTLTYKTHTQQQKKKRIRKH